MRVTADANRLRRLDLLWQLCFAALVLACIAPLRAMGAESAEANCPSMIGRIVSVQGSVEVRRAGKSDWIRVTRLDVPLCQGDWLRTAARSRAALVVLPEKFVRVDQSSTLSVSITGDETVVEFLQTGDQSAQLDGASCGAGYFITRFPRKFKVRTKYLNASVEGTEFLVGVACTATQLAVIEGKVSAQTFVASNASFMLTPGQTVSSGPNEIPAVKLLVKPTDAVQWALFYPPLSEADPRLIDRTCPDPADANKARCLVRRAEQRLRVGRVDDASADIAEARALVPNDADATALLAIIGVVKNEKVGALALSERAVGYDARSPRAWIARSYAQQASFQLESALSSAQEAVKLDPNRAVAHARVAELLMSLGRIRQAEAEARAAVAANANDSRANTVLGFVHLAQIDTRQARVDFQAAIERDSSDPLPRLGLGLAMIREGQLVPGREQIEIAVMLDPTNALVRSYVGKAYYEENTKARDRLAETQFSLAKQLDPNDPTPWFYDALLKQTQNRPVEALQDMEHSIELNGNRAVYRSRLLLDEDRAARGSTIAGIYQDLSFAQLGQAEALNSLSYDPLSYSVHRFLADTYASIPRREVARQSELLQSTLRQPMVLDPVQALRPLGSANSGLPKVGISNSVGPAQAGLNEFNALFARNGFSFYSDALAGSRDTLGEQVALVGVRDNLSFSVAQGRFRTDEFRPNHDFAQDGYAALIQANVSDSTSLQFQADAGRFDGGTVRSEFDSLVATKLRTKDNTYDFRVGLRHILSPGSDVLFNAYVQSDERSFYNTVTRSTSRFSQEAAAAEAQYANVGPVFTYIAGTGYVSTATTQQAIPFNRRPINLSVPDSYFGNAYLYTDIALFGPQLKAQLGVSADYMDTHIFLRNELNPKVGLTWNVLPGTRLRAAAFRTLKRQLIADQTIEPTQVSGFNQFFDDINGTTAWQYGVGADQRITKNLYAGAEAMSRDLLTPQPSGVDVRWKEDTARAYLYWAIPDRKQPGGLMPWASALALEYQYERFRRPPVFDGEEGFVSLINQFVPVRFAVFPSEWWSLHITETHVRQTGILQLNAFPRRFAADERFWITDLGVDIWLPRRKGQITLGVSNLFNQTFLTYQDTDPANPRFARGRFGYARLKLQF